MQTNTNRQSAPSPQSQVPAVRRGFTLVELLVVITIIGILASLITAAGVAALRTAQRNRIKTEINQMDMGLQTFKDTYQSYPPNCQIDDTTETGNEPNDDPIIEAQVLTDLKRAMKQAFPRHREPENVLRMLVGLQVTGTGYSDPLAGGLSSGEALVFWLGGFSSDPKYPISGEGGPSYAVIDPTPNPDIDIPADERHQHDPLQRNWVFPFEVARLQPRTTDNFFDKSGNRFIEYPININGVAQTRRINFWQYVPAQSEQPYLYFDTSRQAPGILNGTDSLIAAYDPPAATDENPNELHVHAVKVRGESAGANDVRIQFANKGKFQILHSGLDGEWGDEAFEEMSVHHIGTNTPEDYLLYPDGPFTGDVADTITNFSEGTLEASQP